MTQADRNSEAVIFLHLPKAAGSTLNRLIEWEYPLLQMYSIDPVFFNWSWAHLKRLSKARLKRTRMFKGHMLFGLHADPSPASDLHYGAPRAGRPRDIVILFYAHLQTPSIVLEV